MLSPTNGNIYLTTHIKRTHTAELEEVIGEIFLGPLPNKYLFYT